MGTRRLAGRVLVTTALAALTVACGGSGDDARSPAAAVSSVAAPEGDAEIQTPCGGWLTSHQSPDGSWEAHGFQQWQNGRRGEGGTGDGLGDSDLDVAVTGLALVGFLLQGYGPRSSDQPRGAAIAWGLHALRERQGKDGRISTSGRRFWATNHALASWALAEAARADAGDGTVQAARRAFAFLSDSLAVRDEAWTTERGPGDLPAIAWAVTAYAAARWADRRLTNGAWRRYPLVSEAPGLEEARGVVAGWLAEDETSWTVGRVGAALLARLAAREVPKADPQADAGFAWLGRHPPMRGETGSEVDYGGWVVAGLALLQARRAEWTSWDAAIRTAVIEVQRKDGGYRDAKGSWDPLGGWGREGGRVFSTAAGGILCLLYYGDEPFWRDVLDVGGMGGVVTPKPPPPPQDDPLPGPERRWPPCD